MRPRALGGVREARPAAPPPARLSSAARLVLAGGLVVLCLALAALVIRDALIQVAPPAVALAVAPGSPVALRRSAEAAFAAGRLAPAGDRARRALAASPFDARAVRVAGLVEAETGNLTRADELLTLAGNWSLRDGAAHLWLTQRRLAQGEFGDAFAHADTLVRRRAAAQPQIFPVFSDAAQADPRAFNALARLLRTAPPWRPAYMADLSGTRERLPLAAALALAVATEPETALTPTERATVYAGLAANQAYPLLKRVSETLEPELSGGPLIRDGGFEAGDAIGPLGWTLGASPGLTSERLAPPEGEGTALHVLSDGYSSGVAAQQLLLLAPGAHRLTGQAWVQQGRPGDRVAWTLACAPSGASIATVPLPSVATDGWTTLDAPVLIPADGCPAQTLALRFAAGERRQTLEIWADDLRIGPAGQARPAPVASQARP